MPRSVSTARKKNHPPDTLLAVIRTVPPRAFIPRRGERFEDYLRQVRAQMKA